MDKSPLLSDQHPGHVAGSSSFTAYLVFWGIECYHPWWHIYILITVTLRDRTHRRCIFYMCQVLHGNIATGAFHYSRESFNVRKCHPDTCAAVWQNHAAFTRKCGNLMFCGFTARNYWKSRYPLCVRRSLIFVSLLFVLISMSIHLVGTLFPQSIAPVARASSYCKFF